MNETRGKEGCRELTALTLNGALHNMNSHLTVERQHIATSVLLIWSWSDAELSLLRRFSKPKLWWWIIPSPVVLLHICNNVQGTDLFP